jgi:chaperonin GroES
MTIKPLRNNLFVEPLAVENKSKSGIIITGADEPSGTKGTVKYAGPLCIAVSVGDVVYYKKYAPEEIELEGVTYGVISEDDVMAIIPQNHEG